MTTPSRSTAPADAGAPDAEELESVSIGPDDVPRILNRLRRAEGQLGAVIRMVEAGRDCREVATQLAATRKALDRAGFAMIASGLRQCQIDESGSRDLGDLERAFLTLA